jgi:DNA-binding NarL/FixJ family response regulator
VKPTTLFMIDDHPVVREGLRMLLDAAGDVRVVGSSTNVRSALDGLARQAPDVVLLDLDLDDEDGLEALPRITAAVPSTRVLILTALRDRALDEAALVAGARGLILKDASPDQLLRAIRVVASGGLWFDPRLLQTAPRAGEPPRTARPVPAQLAALSPRERELVELVAEGLKNEDIAGRLGISEKTVRNNLTAIFDKLGVHDRLQLLAFAYQHGIARPRR